MNKKVSKKPELKLEPKPGTSYEVPQETMDAMMNVLSKLPYGQVAGVMRLVHETTKQI